MRRLGLLAGLVGFLTIAIPAVAQDELPQVIIHVADPRPSPNQLIQITVFLYDQTNPSVPVEYDHPDSLIEVRQLSGAAAPHRPLMKRVSTGEYTTSLAFSSGGDWIIVALPDLPSRSLLPSGSADQVTIEVRSRTSSTIALIALIAGGVTIAILAGPWLRRPKGQPKAPPVDHDSWWFSP